jgi:hypothetical protein
VYLTAGWLTLIRSRSSYKHTYQHAYLCVCVCMYLFFFSEAFFLSVPYSWWPNSLFLVDTGVLICTTTSCRPWKPEFLTGFHCFRECVCFLWLGTEIVCSSESVGVLSLLDLYLSVFAVLLVCVCVCVCVTMCTGRQTDTVERSAK